MFLGSSPAFVVVHQVGEESGTRPVVRVSVPWQCPHLPGVVITGSDQYLLRGVQTHTAEATAVREREKRKGEVQTQPLRMNHCQR